MKSITRFYLCNIEDHHKQTALRKLTGPNVLESNMTVQNSSHIEMGTENHIKKQLAEFRKNESKYSQSNTAKISIFTWNSSLNLQDINENTVQEF